MARQVTGTPGRILTLAVLLAFMAVWRRMETVPVPGAEVTLALGFLLLAAYIGGQIVKGLGLSRITGYILVGMLVGPGLLDLLHHGDLEALAPFNGLAIALIALTAGGELDVARLRGSWKWLAGLSVVQSAIVFAVVFATVLAVGPRLPFIPHGSFVLAATVAMVFASVAIASSPSVAIAVITDTRSRGPVTTAVLGVTIVKDVLVIVLFAVALSVAYAALTPGRGFELDFAGRLAWQVGGSIAAGAAVGAGIAAWLKWVRIHPVLFTLALAWALVEVSAALHFELLLLALSAGFTLENVVPVEGTEFVEALEAASLPVYALFFSLAGAHVDLPGLLAVWYWALGLIAVRAAGIWLGTLLGARAGDAPAAVTRHAWAGYISQAGVALGMVTLVAEAFPEWGPQLRDVFVGMVAVHELVGPVAVQWTLARAGEVGRAAEPEEGAAAGDGRGGHGRSAGEAPEPAPA